MSLYDLIYVRILHETKRHSSRPSGVCSAPGDDLPMIISPPFLVTALCPLDGWYIAFILRLPGELQRLHCTETLIWITFEHA